MLGRVARYGLALLAALGTVGLATPAYAGGIGEVTIDGPRLDRPVRVTWETPGGARMMEDFMVEPSGRNLTAPKQQALGPMYTVRVETCLGQVDQVLYPFAADGPVAYTVPGQVDYWSLPSGWRPAPDWLPGIIAKATDGSDPRPVAASEAKSTPAAEPPASTPGTVAGWLIPLGLVGVGGATLARRHFQHSKDESRTTPKR